MEKTWNTIMIALVFGLILGASSLAWAGYNADGCCGVVILEDRAYGIMADARASSNSKESIGCTTSTTGLTGNRVEMTCSATNSKGKTATCHSSRPAFIKVIQGLSNFSWLYFEYDRPNTECKMVANRVGSPYLPDM